MNNQEYVADEVVEWIKKNEVTNKSILADSICTSCPAGVWQEIQLHGREETHMQCLCPVLKIKSYDIGLKHKLKSCTEQKKAMAKYRGLLGK